MAAVKIPHGRLLKNREAMLLFQKRGEENIQTKLLCDKKSAYTKGSGLRGQGRRRL